MFKVQITPMKEQIRYYKLLEAIVKHIFSPSVMRRASPVWANHKDIYFLHIGDITKFESYHFENLEYMLKKVSKGKKWNSITWKTFYFNNGVLSIVFEVMKW